MPEIRNLIAAVDIAVVDPDLLWRVAHMNLLRDVVVRDFAAPEEALETLAAGRAAVVVVGPFADQAQLAAVAQARRTRPELRILHCAPVGSASDAFEIEEPDRHADAELPQEAAAEVVVAQTAGFDTTVPDDGNEASFAGLVHSLLVAARAAEGGSAAPTDEGDGTAAEPDEETSGEDRRRSGPGPVADDGRERADDDAEVTEVRERSLRAGPGLELPPRLAIITSAKGGEGTSTVALNLAHELAVRAGVRTAVVDGEPFFGDVTMDLGTVATKAPVVTALPLGEDVLEQLVTFPTKPGPIVVRFPAARDDAADRLPEVLRTLLSVAGQVAEVVVADVPFELLVASSWLDQAAVVVLVTTPRTTSLKNAMVAAQRLSGSANVGLVVNEIDHRTGRTSPEEWARSVGLPLLGHLPSSGTLRRAAAKPRPREIAAAHTHYAHAITTLRRAVASHFPVLV